MRGVVSTVTALILSCFAASAWAQAALDPPLPSAVEVERLQTELPITLENWPTWSKRLTTWMGAKDRAIYVFYEAARTFAAEQETLTGGLPDSLRDDYFAWYSLGSAQLFDRKVDDMDVRAKIAEKSLRRAVEMKPDFPQGHRRLAESLLLRSDAAEGSPAYEEGLREIGKVRALDPSLGVSGVLAESAVLRNQPADAAQLFRTALQEEPDDERSAYGLASVLLSMSQDAPSDAALLATRDEIGGVVAQFPESGPLHILNAIALANAGDFAESKANFERARELGVEPTEMLPAETIAEIEQLAKPGFWKITGYVAAAFVALYAVVAAIMALTGLILARYTKGVNAVELLGGNEALIERGQVWRSEGEGRMARLYGVALMGGLVMFYIAIPFIIAGLLLATVGALYGVLMLPRIPIKLLVIIVVVGFGMAWVVLKSLFARASGEFGLPLSRTEEPKLYQAVDQVAAEVDTAPVDKIFLSPGSEIGVHQDGRGPFGMFGVKDRVLTLGMGSLQHLSIDEFKSIMAHEYAHFSHGDTFYGRFIHQVTASIHHSLAGMAQTAGQLNYINPFYWFLVLYYKAYQMMAAGFSRSREFLADRMAVSLYGRDVFQSALTSVATQGTVAEGRVIEKVIHGLNQNQFCVNAYDLYRQGAGDEETTARRSKLHEELLVEKGTVFASHPTLTERFQAVASFRTAARRDTTPARELLASPEEIEQELTRFVTAYFQQMAQVQSAAAS